MRLMRGSMTNAFVRCLFSTRAAPVSPLQLSSMKESCILVDDNDKNIGSASKLDCHKVSPDKKLLLHRAFSVILFNTKDELLLQRRAASKITFPNVVSITCCSHPIEDIPAELDEKDAIGVKLAAVRRLNYELGIPLNEINVEDLTYLTRFKYKSVGDGIWGEYEIAYMLLMQKDVTLNPNSDEVSDLIYVKKQSFDKFMKDHNDQVSPWFKLIADHYLPTWWNSLNDLKKIQDHNTIRTFL